MDKVMRMAKDLWVLNFLRWMESLTNGAVGCELVGPWADCLCLGCLVLGEVEGILYFFMWWSRPWLLGLYQWTFAFLSWSWVSFLLEMIELIFWSILFCGGHQVIYLHSWLFVDASSVIGLEHPSLTIYYIKSYTQEVCTVRHSNSPPFL